MWCVHSRWRVERVAHHQIRRIFKELLLLPMLLEIQMMPPSSPPQQNSFYQDGGGIMALSAAVKLEWLRLEREIKLSFSVVAFASCLLDVLDSQLHAFPGWG